METTKKTIKELAITLVVLCILYFVFPLWLTFGKAKVYDKEGIVIYANQHTDSSLVAKIADEANTLLLKHRTKNRNTITNEQYRPGLEEDIDLVLHDQQHQE